jgi:hypothetical protein
MKTAMNLKPLNVINRCCGNSAKNLKARTRVLENWGNDKFGA